MQLASPFYLHPAAEPEAWQALLSGELGLSFAVVNVNSGPGEERDEHYYGPALAGGSATPLAGYIHLDYGRRPVAEVVADATAWRDLYGITDIMLDCTPAEPEDAAGVVAVVEAVRAAGVSRVILNLGRIPAPGAEAVLDCADVVCTAETDWETYQSMPGAWVGEGLDLSGGPELWHLIHGVPADEEAAARALAAERGAQHAWITDATLPNPWGALPSWYFSP